MDQTIFKEITQILERDSKNTTYKFALLRGTIDIIQSKSPFIQLMHDRARMPIGLMVEKWLLYYYPILNADVFIPQKSGEKPTPGNRLAFRRYFKPVTDFYQNQGGYSAFYNDLVIKGIPKAVRKEFIVLVKVLAKTIVNMPMKYIGRSISPETHSIYSLSEYRTKNE